MMVTQIVIWLNCISFLFLSSSCGKDDEILQLDETYFSPKEVDENVLVNDTYYSPKKVNELFPEFYGAVGDGVNDDTAALQAWLDSGHKNLTATPNKTYIINNTLSPVSNTIIDFKNSVLQSGESLSGTMLTHGRFFDFNSLNIVTIKNIHFKKGSQDFTTSDNYSPSAIHLNDSDETYIKNCFFDFDFTYADYVRDQSGLINAIFTLNSRNTLIDSCRFKTVHLHYGIGQSFNTTVQNCYFYDSAGNGTGSAGTEVDGVMSGGHRIINNTFENVGRIAIEDWGFTQGTEILNNVIIGAGKNTLIENLDSEGMGISAVGLNSIVEGNTISDVDGYAAIESIYNRGGRIKNNLIFNCSTAGIGSSDEEMEDSDNKALFIDNNTILNCRIGMFFLGSEKMEITIANNYFHNFKTRGIYIDYHHESNVLIDNNQFFLDEPADGGEIRKPIWVYSSDQINPTGKNIVINKTSVNYDLAASGGEYRDFGIHIASPQVYLDDFNLDGSDIINTSSELILGLTSNGSKAPNMTINNSTIINAITDLKMFDSPTGKNNFFDNVIGGL